MQVLLMEIGDRKWVCPLHRIARVEGVSMQLVKQLQQGDRKIWVRTAIGTKLLTRPASHCTSAIARGARLVLFENHPDAFFVPLVLGVADISFQSETDSTIELEGEIFEIARTIETLITANYGAREEGLVYAS